MHKVGFIGYGSMGRMLLNQFIESGALMPEEIIIFSRTAGKLEELSEKYKEICIARSNQEVATQAKLVFICTKPLDVINVVQDIKSCLSSESHIVSIAGAIMADYLYAQTGAKVSKFMPTITSEVRGGVSLVYHRKEVLGEDKKQIEELLHYIGYVKVLKDDDFDLVTEITSCGPGFIAGIFREFLDAAMKHAGNLEREEVEEMLIRTLSGTSRLFIEKGLSFDDTIMRVATKGGITEEGIMVLSGKLPNTFDEMFERTLSKRKLIKERLEREVI